MVDSPPPPPAPPCSESLLFLFSRTRWDERRLEGPSLWDLWEGVRGQGETKAGKKQIIAHKANSVPVCATGLLHQEGDLRCPFLKHHEDSNTTTHRLPSLPQQQPPATAGRHCRLHQKIPTRRSKYRQNRPSAMAHPQNSPSAR